jgi:hypothetical protein
MNHEDIIIFRSTPIIMEPIREQMRDSIGLLDWIYKSVYDANASSALEVVTDPQGKEGSRVIAKVIIPKGNQFSLSIKSNSDHNACLDFVDKMLRGKRADL